jgi:anti-sigma factor RsiW
MTCDEFKHDLHLYYTGRLDPSRVEGLEEHRQSCADCARLMVLAEEMTCKESTELLNDYVEGRLPAAQREAFDRHLSICADCTAFLQSYRATMSMSATAFEQAMGGLSKEMPDELFEAILAARAAEERGED